QGDRGRPRPADHQRGHRERVGRAARRARAVSQGGRRPRALGRPAAADRRQGHPRHGRGGQRRRGALRRTGAQRDQRRRMMSSPPPRSPIPRLDELDLVITTARLRLRPFEDRDVDDLWPLVSDPELPRMMSWAAHTDRSQTQAFIQWTRDGLARGSGLTWAIEVDGCAAGSIGLDQIHYTLAALRVDRAELGYWIAPAQRGAGLVTEAAQA